MAISFTSFATTVNSKGAVDRPKGSALNWYVSMSDPGHEISDISWTVPVWGYGSRRP